MGKHGSAESKKLYNEFVRRIIAEENQPPGQLSKSPSLYELAEQYLHWAEQYHTPKEFDSHQTAIFGLLSVYGSTVADEFGPRKLLALQKHFIDQKWARSTVNKRINQVRQMFRWLVSREFLPVETYTALKTVVALRKGKSEAADPEPVQPASTESILAVLPHVSPTVSALIQTQWLCGMRPSDPLKMRPCDIDRSGDIWIYRPVEHKNQHRGQLLIKAIPKQAQTILEPLLDRAEDAHIFDPRESATWHARQRWVKSKKKRRPPSQAKRLRENRRAAAKRYDSRRSFYTFHSYRQAVRRGCEAAQIEIWTPLQLRHAIATQIRQQLGQEAAQVWLGHANLSTTDIYAAKQLTELLNVARRLDDLLEK